MMNQQILLVEDDKPLREALTDTLELAGLDVIAVENAEAALLIVERNPFSLVITDVAMGKMDGYSLLKFLRKKYPQLPVLLMTAYADIKKAVQSIRDGAVDYLVKPFEPKVLVSLAQRFVQIEDYQTLDEFIVVDKSTKQVYSQASKVAPTDASVLITGESGTGKEILAKFLHKNSKRVNGPFVAINCAAIPENMLESTLFGYEKGAFTGAYNATPGKFEQAQNGTILLDEISEMNLALQAKLLRVLQEREVERLGSHKLINLDVRVVATTNRNMLVEIEAGRFRSDLYYRLNVFPLHVSPLRDRPDDLIPVANFLLNKHAKKMQITEPCISDDAKHLLQKYTWPGNIRELENVLLRALILHSGTKIDVSDIQFETLSTKDPGSNLNNSTDEIANDSLSDDIKKHEYQIILKELKAHNGCRKSTAEKLNISPRTLRYKLAKMRELGIEDAIL